VGLFFTVFNQKKPPPPTLLAPHEAADAALQLAFRATPTGDSRVIAEVKSLVRAYLATALEWRTRIRRVGADLAGYRRFRHGSGAESSARCPA
jgi:hypothetical protein